MKISELYQKFQIPPNLQRHMLEVAAVAEYVCEQWTGPKIDQDLILQVCLVHDMGNLVKFKRPFLGALEPNEYWEHIQDEMRKGYGIDAFTATHKILESANIHSNIRALVDQMPDVVRKNGDYSWEVRICDYADCCVTPEGIVGFEKRITDLLTRYPEEPTSTWEASRENARLLHQYYSGEVLSIVDSEWKMRVQKFTNFDIPTEI